MTDPFNRGDSSPLTCRGGNPFVFVVGVDPGVGKRARIGFG